MALKTERSRIRFTDIESVKPFEAVRQAGLSGSFPEPPANEERGMSAQPLPVGEQLRRAREEAGLELADVAAHLRIRSNFLSALEEGHPDALPGITYAIGYVRTYAAFLGLEPDTAVRRFKEEAAGLNAKTQLVFPSPAPEGRVPGLVLMLVAAMLVGGAYGGWYWVSERDGSLRDLVPAVPERLAQLIEGDAPSLPPVAGDPRSVGTYADANPTGATPPRGAAADSIPASPATAIATASTPPPATPPAETVGTAPSAPAAAPTTTVTPARSAMPATAPTVGTAPSPVAQAPAPEVPAPQASVPLASVQAPTTTRAVTGEPTASPAPVASPPAEPAPVVAAATAPPAGTSPAAAEPTPSAGGPDTATAPAAASETPDVTAPPEPAGAAVAAATAASEAAAPVTALRPAGDDVPAAPRIAGLIGASEAAVPAGRTSAGPIDRVMIRATGDSWVQVRDAQGTALFTRVLREGDIYRVPDQAGLRLATGNAGALQILVDGDPAPSLGGFGEVVRNVVLDPSLLAAGTAVGSSR